MIPSTMISEDHVMESKKSSQYAKLTGDIVSHVELHIDISGVSNKLANNLATWRCLQACNHKRLKNLITKMANTSLARYLVRYIVLLKSTYI